MIDIKLGPIETRFAEIIWANEPISTNKLTKLCAETLCFSTHRIQINP